MDNNSELTNKLLMDLVKNQKANNKNLTKTFIAVVIGYTLILMTLIIGFFVYESQFEIEEKAVTQTKLSLEQEASGEDAEINNVMGNMYKDNATHNEGK